MPDQTQTRYFAFDGREASLPNFDNCTEGRLTFPLTAPFAMDYALLSLRTSLDFLLAAVFLWRMPFA